MSFIPAEIIKKKRRGQENSAEELEFFINSYVSGEIPDYQVSAWLMAVCFRGMESKEVAHFTRLMRDSGKTMDFSHIKGKKVDKHSTGGVGDKTTLILAPIAAAAGVYVPMIAGRGLGHTGGTLDKLESIPGFSVDFGDDEFNAAVEKHHLGLIGQTDEICPADKKLYALRDVTGTVDSLPLICGSIMSKKLAEGLDALVLDVKFGSGAFMKTLDEAHALASLLKSTGEQNGLKVSALLTDMNQPLGRYIGNALEVKECVEIMSGVDTEFYAETRELSLRLAGHMIWLADLADDPNSGYQVAKQILDSGAALQKFKDLCQFQGPADLEKLPSTEITQQFCAREEGWINQMDTEAIGLASLELGAGRRKSTDSIDPTAGIEFHSKLGKKVKKGDLIATLYASDSTLFKPVGELLNDAITIEKNHDAETNKPLIAKTI